MKSMNISDSLHAFLKQEAKSNRRSIVGQLEFIVERYYTADKKKDAWKPPGKPDDVYIREKYVPNP